MRLINLDELAKHEHWEKIVRDLSAAATINPEDCRPQGRWIINPDGYYPYCSECKEEPKNRVMTKFCPECGAVMDGKEQGDV